MAFNIFYEMQIYFLFVFEGPFNSHSRDSRRSAFGSDEWIDPKNWSSFMATGFL